ncbi:MAG: hypothetical protein MZW92_37795 [Comamonadaceae bacterium]|nr:hypothetical protein [Comamonadaceae bacterium]
MLVIGGGPAGSTAAALLARARPPRGGAGEGSASPLPHRRIAAAAQSAAVRAPRRRGRDRAHRHAQARRRVRVAGPRRVDHLPLRQCPRQVPVRHAYQVRRSEFDQVLLEERARKGRQP